MINKQELYMEIDEICYDILDEIISPITGIPKGTIWADIFIADLACYTMGNEKQNDKILETICKRYKIPSLDKNTFVSSIDDYWPLAQIALYILINGEHEHLIIDKKDLK